MDKDIIKGKWLEMKGNLKEHWGRLTDDDILEINGIYDQLEGKLQQLYGYDKDEVKKEINAFLDKYHFTEETF